MADKDKQGKGFAALKNLFAKKSSTKTADDSGGEQKAGTSKLKVHISPSQQQAESRKRWMIVAGGGVLVVVLFSVMMGGHKKPPPAAKQSGTVNLTPVGITRQNFETATQAAIKKLTQEARNANDHQAQTDKTLQAIQMTQRDIQKTLQGLGAQFSQVKQAAQSAATAPARSTPPAPASAASAPPPPTANLGALSGPPPPPSLHPGKPAGKAPVESGPPPRRGPLVIEPENGGGPGKKGATVGAHSAWTKNPKAGYIPAGSFAPIVLLTGVEAGTAQSSQSDPQPVLMRIEKSAILPGAARYRVASCFALGSAYGSMSTERAYIRLARLSCVDKHKHLVLDAPLKGYLADSDGMFGLRGTMVERRGALLAKTLLAGFASGLSQALGQAQGTSFVGTTGAGAAFSGTSALKGSLFGGGSKAADMLAKFYLKQAQAIFPVIEVPPRRKATLVVTHGTSLKWSNDGSLYIKKVTPEK